MIFSFGILQHFAKAFENSFNYISAASLFGNVIFTVGCSKKGSSKMYISVKSNTIFTVLLNITTGLHQKIQYHNLVLKANHIKRNFYTGNA
jgi:hypothetical protein